MFYGFDWQNTPTFSRLFNPSVVSRGQSAFNQGMGMFRPFDPRQLEQARQRTQDRLSVRNQPAPQSSSGGFVGPDGRVYFGDPGAENLNQSILGQYMSNNQRLGNDLHTQSLERMARLLSKDNDLTKIGFRRI